MKSSLPQIFNKDLYQISFPQRQSPEYSIFLRTNNFTLKNPTQTSSRYNNKETNQRVNKSMDMLLTQRKTLSLSKQLQNPNGLKSLLTQRRKVQSRSFFIEQKRSQTAEQVDNFKTIRKRVIQEVTLIEKSLTFIDKTENSIKQGLQSFKQNHINGLQQFETLMRRQITELRNVFKTLKKQVNVQIKINKQQTTFLKEQTTNLRSILQGFQHQTQKLINQIIIDQNPKKK